MTEDIPLLRALVWKADGERQYPPRAGMVPVPYTFSDEAETELTFIQAQTETTIRAPFDVENSQLLYCRSVPPVCLIYERVSLEEDLELPIDALASKGSNRLLLLLLTVAACLLGYGYIWFFYDQRRRELQGLSLTPNAMLLSATRCKFPSPLAT